MSTYATLRAALLTWAPLAALVGPRIRVDLAEDTDPMPYVVYRRVNFEKFRGLDNSVHARSDSFQVECWGVTRDQSVQIAEAVDDALDAADLPTDPSDPDAIDPTTAERAVVLNVDIWT